MKSFGTPMSDAAEAAKLRALLGSAVDAIVTIDESGLIDSVNPATHRMFGYDHEELIGRNVRILMPEPYRSQHDGYVRNYKQTGERRIIGIGREVTGLRKDGTTFPMHLSVSEFRADGKRFFTGIIHDLSERKRAEDALHHSQRLDAVGQLTGGIAHDFNNLLTVITGNLELLEPRLESAMQRELLIDAREAADMGARLTQRLLAFARKSQLEPQVVDLNSLVLSLTELLHRTLGEPVNLSTALSTGLWQTRVDPGQVESAIVNLAVNARDAMPEGGKLIVETSNVTIGSSASGIADSPAPGEYVCLCVRDTGTGIPEDIRGRVFEPFFTTKGAGRGTGLGLSMVYGFAKQSGGHVIIDSEFGNGTAISLYLPRHAGTETDEGKPNARESAAPANKLILAVEDDDRVRRLTCLRLRELGFRVLEAANGADALSVLEDNPDIDLVFTDIVMPGGMTGYQLCEEIRGRRPDVRLLLTSGYTEDAVTAEQLHARGLALLRKPYTQADLSAAIEAAFGGRGLSG